MAEIILTPLLQVIFEKLANPVLQKFADYWELEDRFQKLQKVLPMAQAVTQDAEERQITDKVIRIWLTQLKDAASKAEDLLEEFMFVCNGKLSKQYNLNFTTSRNILDDLQKAVVEGLRLPLLESRNNKLDERETSSFVIGSEVCGREDERERIVEKLLMPTNEENVPVVSIVGIPGIGKTTIAQMVYNDDEVKKCFDLRIWIFASRDFKAKRMIKAAIESVTGKKCDLVELDVLQCTLWNLLQNKRYFLVIDDVWNEDEEEWDRLRILFSSGVGGSRVVITTRSQKVAMRVGSPGYAYHLKGLCEEDSWTLFKKRAFFNEEEDKHHSLVEIGKQIVRKCQGVPLGVKVIGGLLRFKREERDWLHVHNTELWDLRAYRKGIFPALVLSYLHLPPHLNHCYTFCSIFPEDYEFHREKLVHMWMAQGYILPESGSSLMEDIGNDYFNELLWMSVLEEVGEYKGDLVGGYKMNKVFYSLARSITGNDFLVLEKGLVGRNLGQVRHASIVSNYRTSLIPEALHQAKHLRSLVIFSEDGLPTVPSDIFTNFIYLRMLYLSGCLVKLPESICENLFLKFLDLSNSHFHELPSAISAIYSLEVLNLFGCYNLKSIPSMSQITGLRHLNISGCEALVEMPQGIKHLVLLQTLPIYIVPSNPYKMKKYIFLQKLEGKFHKSTPGSKKNVLPGSISVLKHLNLQGELKIKHLERVYDVEEAKEANLKDKKYLESLGLCWGNAGAEFIMNPALETSAARFQGRKPAIPGPSEDPEQSPSDVHDPNLAWEVLQCLQPHKNLKKLFIVGYPGAMFTQWTLPNLTEVVLINCRGCVQLPVLGHLPLLRSLRMEGISSIQYIGQEIYGEGGEISFPSLEELVIRYFPALKEWISLENKVSFPKLRKAVLDDCPNLISVPHFTSLDRLELRRCSSAVLKYIETLSLLSTLSIEGFDDLIFLPDKLIRNNPFLKCVRISSCPNLRSLSSAFRGLASLASLIIRWCENLTLLPGEFEELTALEFLEISDCHNVENLPDNILGHLTSLQDLSIENCSSLTSISFGFQPLTALKHFTIMYSPSLAVLPNNFENLSSLTSLTIISCPLIEFLPEGIKTLRSLEIRSCPRLAALPEWIDSLASLRTFTISDCCNLKSLPVAFGRLTKLQRLTIQDCPHLHRRCRQDCGEDWWKIAHIPFRHIFSSEPEPSCGVGSSLA